MDAIKFPTNKSNAIEFPTSPVAVKAAKLKLDKRMGVEKAYQAILRNCVAQIQANEDGVARFSDVESLHQMRVGLRRLRSAQSMFRDLITVPAELADDINWLTSQLGPARDWDVLAGTTLATIGQESGQPAELVELTLAAQDKTHELHRVASSAVSSERYRTLLTELDAWLARRGWREEGNAVQAELLKQRIGAFADQVLARDQKRLKKRGSNLRTATPEARHRTRIAAKKTRYAAEFFGSLYRPGKVKSYVAALSVLQDELGALNDASVAQGLLDTLAQEKEQVRAGVGFVRGYLAARSQASDKRLTRAWKRFSPLPVPR